VYLNRRPRSCSAWQRAGARPSARRGRRASSSRAIASCSRIRSRKRSATAIRTTSVAGRCCSARPRGGARHRARRVTTA
jgi:hypothetical protein